MFLTLNKDIYVTLHERTHIRLLQRALIMAESFTFSGFQYFTIS